MNRPIQFVPIGNRLSPVLQHVWFYATDGQARLAADCRVSRSTISRLVGGKITPSYRLSRAVTEAVSLRLGFPVDMRDLFTTDGTYPTASVCELTRSCPKGCLPREAWDEVRGILREGWQDAIPGDWCRYPGYPSYPTAFETADTSKSVSRSA